MTKILEGATDLQIRIWSEFQTMPGLRLTREQACRLFGGEPNKVLNALQELVDVAALRQVGQYYIRADFDRFTA
jgi:hypothetical protein